jgi:hypothetical protein
MTPPLIFSFQGSFYNLALAVFFCPAAKLFYFQNNYITKNT